MTSIPWEKRAPAQCLGCFLEFALPAPTSEIIRCPHCGSSAYRWPPQPVQLRRFERESTTGMIR